MRNMAKKNMAKKEAQRRLKPKFAKHHKCHRVMKAAITTTGGSKGDLVTLQPFINIESGSCHTSIGSLLYLKISAVVSNCVHKSLALFLVVGVDIMAFLRKYIVNTS